MKRHVILAFGLCAPVSLAMAQAVYARSYHAGGIPGAAPQRSTTAGNASPISGANGSVGGTPGNSAASGTSKGPGFNGTTRHRRAYIQR